MTENMKPYPHQSLSPDSTPHGLRIQTAMQSMIPVSLHQWEMVTVQIQTTSQATEKRIRMMILVTAQALPILLWESVLPAGHAALQALLTTLPVRVWHKQPNWLTSR